MFTALGSEPSSVPEGFLQQLDESLRRTFGSPFTLWLQGPSWRCWRAGPAQLGTEAAGDLSESWRWLIEAAAGRPAGPVIRPDGEGGYQMAFAVRSPQGPLVVAAGKPSLSPAGLLNRLAEFVQNRLTLGQRLYDYRRQLGDYARQVTEDLEEIQFLLSLSEHLELCDVRRSVSDVAESVLPVLRELIRAEGLATVRAAHPGGGGPCNEARPSSPVVWFGPRVFSDRQVQTLVARFRDAASQQPVVRNRIARDRAFADFPGLDSFVLAAVGVRDSCTGWLLAVNRRPSAVSDSAGEAYPGYGLSGCEFGSVEASMMGAAAVMLATHGRNLHFVRDRETLLVGALRALINAIDAKDSYTCGHSDRVALIARRLGEQLGLNRQQREQLYLAGLLHDIGKIGIPDSVLLKAGKLTEEELGQIKRHPERGHAILKHLSHLTEVLPGVLHHHERWDGRGYPHGLGGEAIPLAARIIAVADAYDAMTSSRPYRRAMPEEKAEDILRRGAGSQWDRRVIEALFLVLDDVRAICREAHQHTRALLEAGAATPQPGLAATDSLAGAVKEIHVP